MLDGTLFFRLRVLKWYQVKKEIKELEKSSSFFVEVKPMTKEEFAQQLVFYLALT